MTAWKPGSPVDLTTERFRIRSAMAADVDATYLGWFADRETMQFVGPDLARLTRDQHLAIVASADNRTRMLLTIVERKQGQRIGWMRVEIEPRHKRMQTSIVIGNPAFRWQGGHVEVSEAVRLFMFAEGDIRKMTFMAYGAHTSMIKHLDNEPNVVKEGVLRRHDFVPGLGWQDAHVYAVFRSPEEEKRPEEHSPEALQR